MDIPNLPGYKPTQNVNNRQDSNELPKMEKFNYTKEGQIMTQTLGQTIGQTINKENCSGTFRLSKNNYEQFQNISHGNDGHDIQEEYTDPNLGETRCAMTEMLQNTVNQGMYQTVNAKTYNCSGWESIEGNKNLDRPSEVLSFKGIFAENIENSRLETQRVRRLVIQYFLEDNSVKISEPVQRNSGIRQGKFLSRQKVPRLGGAPQDLLQPMDFMIGNRVSIFGRCIEVLDCDEFSRNFFSNVLGQEVPPGYDWEKDNFESQVLEKFNMKEYYGKKSWVNNVRVKSQKQFYALDTKVLRMFLQDVHSKREYIMFYFLADDSIELKIHNETNRCQDLHLTYLKRRKVPLEFQVELPGLQQENEFLKFNSFEMDVPLRIIHRDYLIVGVDQFTHDHMLKELGREMALYQPRTEEKQDEPEQEIPPHNGFGDEEDSRANCFRLILKPPKQDPRRLLLEETKLTFAIQLFNPKIEDRER